MRLKLLDKCDKCAHMRKQGPAMRCAAMPSVGRWHWKVWPYCIDIRETKCGKNAVLWAAK